MATIVAINCKSEIAYDNMDGASYRQNWEILFTGAFDAVTFQSTPLNDGTHTLPRKGNDFKSINGSTDTRVFCSEVQIERSEENMWDASGATSDNPGVAIALCTFTQKSYNYDPNPLNRPAEIEGAGSDETHVSMQDINGDAIINSANELYAGIPPTPSGGSSITITRNEATNPRGVAKGYSWTVNNADINDILKGNGRFGRIAYKKVNEIVNGINVVYYQVTYPILERTPDGNEFGSNGWNFKPIDNGFSYLSDPEDDDSMVRATDTAGRESRVPILLDGSGGKLTGQGNDPANPPVVFPAPDGYQILYSSSWDALDLPDWSA